MKLKWTFYYDTRQVETVLIYDVYTLKKKLYVDGKKILELNGVYMENEIDFIYNESKYKIELIPEGYGYSGYLITPTGSKIPNKVEKRIYYKLPIWAVPFIIVNMCIPIISVEALRPWIIGILSSYITVRFAKRPRIKIRVGLGVSLAISVLAWAAYYMFYLGVRNAGMNGGFLY